MKMEELARPGLIALGLLGIATTAMIGFAAGVAIGRDPETLRRTARRLAREAALGLERATLMAAQAREQAGDMWAEVREEARAEVDAADFEHAAARSAAAMSAAEAAAAAEVPPAPKAKVARKRSSPRKPRGPRAAAPEVAADDAAGQG